MCAHILHIMVNRWKKNKVYEDLSRECTARHMSKLIIGMGDFNGHAGRNINGLQSILRRT